MSTSDAQEPCCPSGERPIPGGVSRRRRASQVFRALSDTTRMELFALIAARPEPICVCDIVARFELSQPTISHHLKILREADLVTATRRGTWSYYEVDERGIVAARRLVDAVFPDVTRSAR